MVAESVLTVALALQLVAAVVLILFSAIIALAALAGGAFGIGVFAFFGVFGLVIGIVTGVLLAVAYFMSYAPARRGEYARAKTPTLVLGVIFLVLVVTAVLGVLYILAYGRLSDAVPPREVEAAPTPEVRPASANPELPFSHKSWVRCLSCGLPVVWPARTCPRCQADVAAQYAVQGPGQKAWVRCVSCGLPVEWPGQTCQRCGANVATQYTAQVSAPTR